MRGPDSESIVEEELSLLLRDVLGHFAREAEQLNRIAQCMESAVALLPSESRRELSYATAALRASAAHAASLVVTLHIRLASVEGLGSALALLRGSRLGTP